MELPEDHPDTVDLFIQYLYGKECELPICEADSLFQYYMACVKLLIFANRYDVQSLKRYILGQLIRNTVRKPRLPMPPQKAVRYVYDNTSSKSGIRKFFADWYVWRVERDWFQQQAIQDWLLENLSSLPSLELPLTLTLLLLGKALHRTTWMVRKAIDPTSDQSWNGYHRKAK